MVMERAVFFSMIAALVSIALFSFLGVTVWSVARRREREAYYKSETLKKIAETQGSGAGTALEFLREEEKISARRRREGQKLGGLISCAVGIGMIAFLGEFHGADGPQAQLAGLIPFLVGVVLLAYAYILAPKE
jgi:hypothetical protein